MQLLKQFLSRSKIQQVFLFVLFFHIAALLMLWMHHFTNKKLKTTKPILIRTVVQPPHIILPKITATTSKPPIEASPKKIETPSKKIVKSLPATPKKASGPSTPIAKPSAIKKGELSIPAPIATSTKVKQTERAKNDMNFGDFLVQYLQNTLELPEYGEVKMEVTIDQGGHLTHLQILDSKSEKNAQFLKNRLPTLPFPCLNDFDIFEMKQTFTITFKNA